MAMVRRELLAAIDMLWYQHHLLARMQVFLYQPV